MIKVKKIRLSHMKSLAIVITASILLLCIMSPGLGVLSDTHRKNVLAAAGVIEEDGFFSYQGRKVRFLSMHEVWDSGLLTYMNTDPDAEVDIKLVRGLGGYEILPWSSDDILMRDLL